MACEKCAEFGGGWVDTPRGFVPCRCPAGKPLREKPAANKPVLTSQAATVFVEMLASIPFFPSESGARLAIGDELRAMCAGPKEADWLVTRMRRLYNRWPGPTEMRRVYVSKLKPWDGVMPLGESEYYPDHIPVESEARDSRLLAGPAVKLLGEGRKHEIVEDPAADREVKQLAREMAKMPAGCLIGGRFEAHLRELETPPNLRPELPAPTPQIITQADIDAEVARMRASKDRQSVAAGDRE